MTRSEREAAIVQLFPLVKLLARSTYRRATWVEFDELVGCGTMALIAAVDDFDCTRGMPLERFARRTIRFAMLDALRREDRVSQRARRVLARAERDRFEFALEIGRMPSQLELERRHPELRGMCSSANRRRVLSLESHEALERSAMTDWSGDPAIVVCERETQRAVMRALGRLPAHHRLVLGMYYARGARLAELAQRLSLTTQRVAQVRDVALASVRKEVIAS